MAYRAASRLQGTYIHVPRALRTLSSLPSSHTFSSLPVASLDVILQWNHQSSQQTRPFSASTLYAEETSLISVPAMAESISEGVLTTFHKQVGDYVKQDEELASIETDKIDVAVNASESGKITKFLVSEGDTVTVGQAVVEVSVKSQDASQNTEPEHASDSVGEVKGQTTSSEPQPTPEPERKESAPPQVKPQPAAPAARPKDPVPAPRTTRAETKEKMTRLRLRFAERLKEFQNTAAFLTTLNEVDMTKIMEFRSKNQDDVLKKYGVQLGFMGPVARASALALKEIPAINASIENNDTIVFKDYIDLSIAVATRKGLVTPVLRNVEDMSVVEIEKGIAELGKRARDNKLSMRDLVGGSFTISNSGMWGSLFGTPIINMPQTAVLGIYGIKERPVAVNGQVVIRPMMYTALTYDHRLVDGREAVTFLTLVKKYLEDPATMLIE
ncbi:dihydrolipoamide succinyltransferase [Aspergillus ibericus CBS 121593]|uniref:Dihydrolipoamide acetyltransferase component of pyruvate dehydrogenase complex n=1 Tax=Aspergillus ibericus CBS 121593 TaxID=1448316 RepID=A0A395GST3_9EURO|nr:dihydrolipoamide succinyltransferase [Aspergillus ibericus CBS 121593]RAK98476.1 dihydrolipoamide succinyltransferase [Aspergillus ibericus CBS 121593]